MTLLQFPVFLGNVKVFFYLDENIRYQGKSTPFFHDHADYELHYIEKGSKCFATDGVTHELKAGDLLLVKPNSYHYPLGADAREPIMGYSLRFSIKEPTDASSEHLKKGYRSLLRALDTIGELHDSEMQFLPAFQALTREINEKSYGYYYTVKAICEYIFTLLLRFSGCSGENILPFEEKRHVSYYRQRIDHFLCYRYMEDIRLSDLADALKLSQRQVSRLMQKEYGMGFIAKLNETRLLQAEHLLLHTDKSIRQISLDCGFSDYNYFLTIFKKRTGVSPTAYRSAP
ncbi:MAG: helix-turn-helix transcriptional regulator [Clostridia bacterium]|nr:helix-turn-helix transcriptional regulator [Clostridia bacterium]